MSKAPSGQPARPSQRRPKAPAPRFEIVYEKPPGDSLWERLRAGAEPFLNAAQNALGSAYLVAARAVLERVEALEDARAEQGAHAAATRTRPLPEPAPTKVAGKQKAVLQIEGPGRRKPARSRPTSSGTRA